METRPCSWFGVEGHGSLMRDSRMLSAKRGADSSVPQTRPGPGVVPLRLEFSSSHGNNFKFRLAGYYDEPQRAKTMALCPRIRTVPSSVPPFQALSPVSFSRFPVMLPCVHRLRGKAGPLSHLGFYWEVPPPFCGPPLRSAGEEFWVMIQFLCVGGWELFQP